VLLKILILNLRTINFSQTTNFVKFDTNKYIYSVNKRVYDDICKINTRRCFLNCANKNF